ncbi:MAG: glycosyltransferase [Deltaproteobacteria bacterium]|nr:glycosyltransferase [Deltaproteobacteria bacterium]
MPHLPCRSLKVLITNITLATRTGTEVYVRDLALGLLRRGHKPIVYSTHLGGIARELRAKTVPVLEDLTQVSATPDIIHGHHLPETMMALLQFPGVPGIFFCHDWSAWHDVPPRFPRILRYVAVDDTCLDRLILEHGVAQEKARVILNFVDLERFKPRGPLPERPKRALVFSNQASERTHLSATRQACSQASITLDIIGASTGTSVTHPEEVLGHYDLVFAKGKSALEALSVGAAVILCDAAGAGPMVTTAELERLRRLNFGIRALQKPVRADVLAEEISRYNAEDSQEVSRKIRASAGLETALDELIALYDEVTEEYKSTGPIDPEAEERAAASYIHQLAVKNQRLQSENRQLRSELETVYDSPTLRLRNRLVNIPIMGSLMRSLARLAAR